MEPKFCTFVPILFRTLNIKLDVLISMKFLLVKVLKLDLHVNYYFKIIDLVNHILNINLEIYLLIWDPLT